jgi:hypothetical protein
MTDYDSLFAQMGVPILEEKFGEPLIYFPRGKSPRPITGTVERGEIEQVSGQDNVFAQRLTVSVPNSAAGIWSGDIDTGGDEIEVALRLGATDAAFGPKRRRIARLVSDHSGMTVFEVDG